MQGQESVPSVLEADAKGEIADIYADIRKVLGTSVVNLIWPTYLALVRTMMAPLQRQGRLNALTLSTRALG
jgi:hypothetical protein